MLDADDAAGRRTRGPKTDPRAHQHEREQRTRDHVGSLVAGGMAGGGTTSTGAGSSSPGSTGSTDGHRYAKYSPPETISPKTNARTNGSQITPR